MEMSHQGGAEAESLLRPDQRNAVVMPGQKPRWEGDGEKAPFLRNEPVKLTPAWEGTNLPNDTLNLKGIAMDLVPPKDRWNLIYLTLMLHGLGTLIGWNIFITARDYFESYKLKDAPEYANMYLLYVGWASQTPNLMFSWFNVFVQIKGNLTNRILWSIVVEVLLFVITIMLAMLDTSQYSAAFFWCTILTVFLLNASNAIFQNSVYGVAARLPPAYTGAVVLGSNIAGTLVVGLSMCTKYFDTIRTASIYYFIGGMFVLLVCLDTYFALPLNRFYRYHDTLQQRALRNNPALAANQPAVANKPPYRTIFKQAKIQLYNIFITFFVTLCVFPNIHSRINMSQSDFFLGTNFMQITCFLTFNVMAMLGNITASLWQFPNRRWLIIFTTARLLFIPLYLICNFVVPDRTMPVVITNDWVYWIIAVVFAWTHGHAGSLGMMYVGGTVAPEHSSTAGMIGGATLVTGIVIGITISGAAPWFVSLGLWKNM